MLHFTPHVAVVFYPPLKYRLINYTMDMKYIMPEIKYVFISFKHHLKQILSICC